MDSELSETVGSPDGWKATYAGELLWEINGSGVIGLNNIILSHNTREERKEPRSLLTTLEDYVFKTWSSAAGFESGAKIEKKADKQKWLEMMTFWGNFQSRNTFVFMER